MNVVSAAEVPVETAVGDQIDPVDILTVCNLLDRVFQDRLACDRQQRFRGVFRERVEPGSVAGGKNNRLQ